MSSRLVSRRVLRALSGLTPVLGIGLAVPIALAGTAGAAEPTATAAVNEYGWHLTYTAAPGQANQVAITQSFTSDRTQFTYVIDDVVPINAGNGCGYPDSADTTKISCTVEAPESQSPLDSMEMDLGDGDDTVSVDNATDQIYYFNTIELGDGNDKGTSDTGRRVDGSSVRGGAGDDIITVGTFGYAGGGDGDDTVYANGEGGVVNANAGDDVIHGGESDQLLRGDDGDDTVYGGDGDDELYGGRGNDILHGNGGADRMWGNSGDDELYGGPGTDTLSGGPGNNIVRQD
ncbi:calcium-binding protein [Streptomyces montanus]|uniref:calcium-binding protein n=1 Tax=Streptomyces montanus TaxID=2580423 RepID=UPI0014864F07|nr:calcium-binding protein [Streptomyces montanus]